MNLHDASGLLPILNKCTSGDRRAQNELYKLVFPYAMSIALRYARNEERAVEVVNEAFFKVFTYLEKYDHTSSFAAWVRKIVINTSIDHFHRLKNQIDRFVPLDDGPEFSQITEIDLFSDLSAEEILRHIRSLSPAYQMVFSLYAIEGYTHKEIAEQLGINEGTSKSNYHKAKTHLQQSLIKSKLVAEKKIQQC
jgi:RNA polymerase sigma-70 factor, ECF subfamily